MEKKQYSWIRNISTVDPKVAGERLFKLTKQAQNKLTPHIVVEDARPPHSPLHAAFEWDDRIAGEEYRLYQARNLIRNLRVIVEQSATPETPKRVFVHVALQEETGEKKGESVSRYYTPVVIAMQSPAIRDSILERALAELSAFRQKYSELKELAAVFAAIDAVLPAPDQKQHAA